MSPEILHLIETVLIVIAAQIVAPLIKNLFARDRNKAETAVIDADAAARLKDTAADQVELALKQVDQLTKRMDTVETENLKLKAANGEIMRELAQQQIINERIREENKALKTELDAVKAENQDLKKALSDMRAENTALKERVRELETVTVCRNPGRDCPSEITGPVVPSNR